MENFNNYQQVIDALKAAYVDARNIKRLANQQKRQVNNAGSYLDRKENEKSSLGTKVDSLKGQIQTNTSNSFTDIQNAKNTIFRGDLAELKSKLVEIEKEKQKLDAFAQLDTEITSVEYNEMTATQLQTIGMIQNMVVNAIGQSEAIFADAYNNGNYYNLKSSGSAVPNYSNSPHASVWNYYMELTAKFENLCNDTYTKFENLIESYFFRASSCKDKKGDIYYFVTNLEVAKGQLASLLENGGTESEISAKETEIEGYKATILETTEYLKMDIANFNTYTDKFVTLVEEYFDSVSDAYTDLEDYWLNNQSILTHAEKTAPHSKSQELLFNIIRVFFNKMENIFGTFSNISPYGFMRNKLEAALYYGIEERRISESRSIDLDKISSPLNMTEIYYDEAGSPVRRIRKDVSNNTFVDALGNAGNLQEAFADYVRIEADRQQYAINLSRWAEEFDISLNEWSGIASAVYQGALTQHTMVNEAIKFSNGKYIGTPEQEAALIVATDNRTNALDDLLLATETKTLEDIRRARYMALFPEFYSTFTPLYEDWRPSLEAKLLLRPTHDALEDAKNAAESALNSIIDTVGVNGPGYDDALWNFQEAESEYAAFVIIGGEWDSTYQLEAAKFQTLKDYLDNVQLPTYLNVGDMTSRDLLLIEDHFVDVSKNLTSKEDNYSQKLNEYFELRDTMTFVGASAEDQFYHKRTFGDDLYRMERLNYDLNQLKSSQEDLLTEIVNKIGGHVNLLNNIPSSTDALQNGIDFLTSINNRIFTVRKDLIASNFSRGKSEAINDSFRSLREHLCPSGLAYETGVNGNIMSYIKNNNGLSNINELYSSMLSSYVSTNVNINFANAAIDYVNNGGSFTL